MEKFDGDAALASPADPNGMPSTFGQTMARSLAIRSAISGPEWAVGTP